MHEYDLTRVRIGGPSTCAPGVRPPSRKPAQRSRHAYRIHEHVPFLALLATSVFVLNGCVAIGGIFKAGVWTGVLAIVVALALFSGIGMIVRR